MNNNFSIVSLTNLATQTQLPCYLVNNLSTNSYEQCKFILDNNCLEKDATFDYVYLVYCELGYELRLVSIILLAFLVIVLFLALSSIADEFLCPSLLSVAKNLKMSDSLAGVTLLAFGNGCPDIFASIAAASGDRSELIVGELLGAGIFCTSIVSGLIFIHSDFKLATRPILRDTTFYLLAVYLVWCYCESREVTFYGSLTFILIYVIYLIVALSGQAIHSRLLGNYQVDELQNSFEHLEEKQKNENWYKWREESLRRRRKEKLKKQLDSFKLELRKHSNEILATGSEQKVIHLGKESFSNLNNVVNSTNKLKTDLSPYLSTSTSTSSPPSNNKNLELQLYSTIKINNNSCYTNKIKNYCSDLNNNNDNNYRGYINEAFICDRNCVTIDSSEKNNYFTDDKEKQQFSFNLTSLKLNENNIDNCDNIKKIKKYNSQLMEKSDLNLIDDLLAHISPINWQQWKNKNIIAKIIIIIRVPLLFLAILTIPVVDYDKKRKNWCKLLNSLHCLTIPFIITILICSNFLSNSFLIKLKISTKFPIIPIPIPLLILIPSLIIFIIVLRTSTLNVEPKYHFIFSYFGFLMSILWIYTIANEIIGLLKTVGIIFSMTDTAIGLGILAWGNSLGDIVANISLAEAGYPRMALGASIGAPLLNLLLGFGLSFTLNMKPNESIEIEYSPTITLLCSTLAIILISIMFTTLLPPMKSKKPFGYMLISGYGIYFALAICFEYGIIKF